MTEILISRPARTIACPKCGRHILAAVVWGAQRTADLNPLTINEEIAARIMGRSIFELRIQPVPRAIYLRPRMLIQIRAGRNHPVVAEHPCQPAIPILDGIALRKLAAKRPAKPASRRALAADTPPF